MEISAKKMKVDPLNKFAPIIVPAERKRRENMILKDPNSETKQRLIIKSN